MERRNNIFVTLHPNAKKNTKKIEVENMDNTFAISLKFGNDLVGLLIGVLVFLIGYIFYFRKKKYSLFKLFILLLLCIYIAMVIGVTLTPFPLNAKAAYFLGYFYQGIDFSAYYNLIPFSDIINNENQFILNIILFIPFGILWPLYKDRINLRFALLSGFLFTFFIEITQLGFSCAFQMPVWYFDVNDLIANTLGAVIGYIILKILIKPVISSFLK